MTAGRLPFTALAEVSAGTGSNENKKVGRARKNGLENGVHLHEAAAWRSNAGVASPGRAVNIEFLAQSCEISASDGLDIRDRKSGVRSSL